MMVVDGDQREGISRHRLVFRFIASASFLEIKKVLSHHWDKTEKSCGTTQVDAQRPLVSRTIIRAALVTGAVPVRGY